MNKKVVYVTGCLGLIGSELTKKLLNRDYYVIGVDNETYASSIELLKLFNRYNNFKYIKSDINNLNFLYECDYIINTAAETHVGNSIVNSSDFMSTNINGVYHLLELLRNKRQETSEIPIFIHFSTDEVYGDIDIGFHKETDLLKPSNPYSASKAASDMLILAWSRTYNIPFNIVRPTNNYGLYQYNEKLIPKVIKYLHLGKKIPLHNYGKPIRNWLYCEDTAEAILTIIDNNCVNEIFNISGSFEQSNIDTVKKIIKIWEQKTQTNKDVNEYIDFSYHRKGQDVRYALDDSKIRNLGWKPKTNFDLALEYIVIESIKKYNNSFSW